jgi:hypothetical protein
MGFINSSLIFDRYCIFVGMITVIHIYSNVLFFVDSFMIQKLVPWQNCFKNQIAAITSHSRTFLKTSLLVKHRCFTVTLSALTIVTWPV